MREDQYALLFEEGVEGLTDHETFILVHAIVLGIPESSQPIANSFVVILRDETQF
jgi:hypothetical protein